MYIACLPTSVAIALIELRRLYHLITRTFLSTNSQQRSLIMAVVIFLCFSPARGIAIGLPIARSLLLCGAALMAYRWRFDADYGAKLWLTARQLFFLTGYSLFVLPVKS